MVDLKGIPVFIIFRDLIGSCSELITWLEKVGQENIHIIDNDSTYGPAIDYLKHTPHTVHYLKTNVGHTCPWEFNIVDKVVGRSSNYIVSDSDIVPRKDCPSDAIAKFHELLEESGTLKVGFGLDISNLPDHNPLKDQIIDWEQQFWHHVRGPFAFEAAIDTTFALYQPLSYDPVFDPNDRLDIKKDAWRTNYPYVARHASWYWDPNNLSEDVAYYLDRVEKITHWTARFKGIK